MAARGWELEQILDVVRPVVPSGEGRVLEIGTHQGQSLRSWRTHLDPALLLGIQDTDETAPATAAELRADVFRGLSQSIEAYRWVRGMLGESKLDFLYIDGDHLFDPAYVDWQMYSPLVRSGGVVALDDAVIRNNPTVEIYRLWPIVSEGLQSKVIYHPDGTGVGMVWMP